MITSRRSFLTGMFVSLAAPAIVSAASLMPISVKLIVPDTTLVRGGTVSLAEIRAALLPGLFDVYGMYTSIPRQWGMLFKSANEHPHHPDPARTP